MRVKKLLMQGVALSFILSGCATTRSVANKEVFHSISETLKVPPVVVLTKGNSQRIEIAENISPRIFNMDKSHHFEVASLQGGKGEAFEIEVAALCDCLGFRKWAISSDVYLLTSQGELVDLAENGGLEVKQFSGVFPDEGEYRLIVVANASNVGRLMGSVKGYTASGSSFSMPLTIHPTGEVVVKWNDL